MKGYERLTREKAGMKLEIGRLIRGSNFIGESAFCVMLRIVYGCNACMPHLLPEWASTRLDSQSWSFQHLLRVVLSQKVLKLEGAQGCPFHQPTLGQGNQQRQAWQDVRFEVPSFEE